VANRRQVRAGEATVRAFIAGSDLLLMPQIPIRP